MLIVKTAVPAVSQRALTRFTQRARQAAGVCGEVNVVLTSSREMRALNRRFRGQDKPTDVLSFPALPVWPDPVNRVAQSRSRTRRSTYDFSGDIVISSDVAKRNARLYQHAPAQELKILILHGMLHLAGYDHESDRGQMARREDRLRRQLGLSNGLIRRTREGSSPAALGRESANGLPRATGPHSRRSAIDRRRRTR